MADPRLPKSNPATQPFEQRDVAPDYVRLSQPKLLASAHNLRGGLYGYQPSWSLTRRRLALAQRYGQELAGDQLGDDDAAGDDWRQ